MISEFLKRSLDRSGGSVNSFPISNCRSLASSWVTILDLDSIRQVLAQVGKIAPDHIELNAGGGWDILIETDGEGRLAQGTHVAFPVKLGGRPLKFNCRPADPTVGYLHITARTDEQLEGSFQLQVAFCKNAVSGKTAAWPYQPLKVRGNFAGLKKQG